MHAQLSLPALPLLDGAAEVLGAGVTSSLHVQNARATASVQGFDKVGAPGVRGPERIEGLLADWGVQQCLQSGGCRVEGFGRVGVLAHQHAVPWRYERAPNRTSPPHACR